MVEFTRFQKSKVKTVMFKVKGNMDKFDLSKKFQIT